ncbi:MULTISPECIES: hypothetical protein [Oscillatoriales]|uniref:hypothetical protein n=1 Tax=Oscillatoriophycideae TaxID=1301283 RepID=UPI001684C014|nr:MULTISPECIES: hypothetical protein [Oscillatoriales]
MATIKISDLHAAGSELLLDSESYLNELTNQEGLNVLGGGGVSFSGHGWYFSINW